MNSFKNLEMSKDYKEDLNEFTTIEYSLIN